MREDAPHTPIGVSQSVTLIGPFSIGWGTAGLEDAGGALLADLDVGTVILNCWVDVFEDFDGGSTTITIGGWQDGAMQVALMAVGVHLGDDRSFPMSSANTPLSPFLPSRVRASGVSFRARVDGTNLTTGEADIYALIGTSP